MTGALERDKKRHAGRLAAEPDGGGQIGGPPEAWEVYHPAIGYQKFEELRTIWRNCAELWPWLERADRDALQAYCRLKYKEDREQLSGAELTAIHRLRSELGGTGVGRARRGILNAPAAVKAARSTATPREAFLARRTG